jgi:hypothetical protein
MRLNYVFEVRCSYVCVTSRFSRCVSYCYGLWTVHTLPTFVLPSHSVPIISSWERRWMIWATVRTQPCRNEGITDFLTIIVAQPFQKFPALYGTQMFSTVSKITHHWILPWLMNRIFKLAQYFKIRLNVFFLCIPGCPKCSLSIKKILVCTCRTSWKHATCPTNSILHYDPKIFEEYCVSVSQWPRGLRRGSAAAFLLGLLVRISPGAWMSCLLWVFVVRWYRSLRRVDHSSRGGLPSVVCLIVIVKPG